jgi:hypothetical protein
VLVAAGPKHQNHWGSAQCVCYRRSADGTTPPTP